MEHRLLTGRNVAQQVANDRQYQMVPPSRLHSFALAGQKGAVSRNHVSPDGVATIVESHFGQTYWFVMVVPKEKNIKKQKEIFERAYEHWFQQDWDVLALNPTDTV